MTLATLEQVQQSLEKTLGMKVHRLRRQARWRPCWFVEGERDGAAFNVVVRAERVDTCVQPLTQEVKFHRLLEENGILVPKIHGWLEDLGAVVLDMVPGRPDFHGTDEADRNRVVDEYLQQLAKLHALPIAPFVEAGLLRAKTPEESGMMMHFELERLWRTRKRHPNPHLEFCLGWLHRNPPLSKGRETPILWDSGQFHHHDGHLTAVLDLEFGHIGDPMADITVWRMRDTLIPFGDFKKLYARYEELTGTEVDVEACKRHHLAAALSNDMIFGPAFLDPVAETDQMNNMQWTSETNLHATEALAEYMGLELPTVELPDPKDTRTANTFEHLIGTLRRLGAETGDFVSHEIRLAFRTVRHLARANEIGDAVVEADLDDIHKVTGKRPENWREGDAWLEQFVLADKDTGKFDEQLVWLFHRRNLRNHMQMGPAGSKMVEHFTCQRFDDGVTPNTALFEAA